MIRPHILFQIAGSGYIITLLVRRILGGTLMIELPPTMAS